MKKDKKQRLFEVMSRLDKTFKPKLNENLGDIDQRENLEYFLSFNNDDIYWKWINGEIDDNGAIQILNDIDGIEYNPNVDYKKEYSSMSENIYKDDDKTSKAFRNFVKASDPEGHKRRMEKERPGEIEQDTKPQATNQFKKDLNENDPIQDVEDGSNLSIGDVVTVDGLEGEYQIMVKYSEGKPFLMPFDMTNKKPIHTHRIFLTALNQPQMKKVLSFSDTGGGFMSENDLTERWGRKSYSTYGYKNDPRIITLKYNAVCDETGRQLKAGEEALYYPSSKSFFGLDTKQAEEFRNWKADIDMGYDY